MESREKVMQKTAVVWFGALVCCALWGSAFPCIKIGYGMFSIPAEGFIFFSTVAYAFSSVLLKCYSKTENPVMLSGYQFLLGGVLMSVVGFAAGGILLKYNPVSKVAVFGFMNPVFGVILSAVLLSESRQQE